MVRAPRPIAGAGGGKPDDRRVVPSAEVDTVSPGVVVVWLLDVDVDWSGVVVEPADEQAAITTSIAIRREIRERIVTIQPDRCTYAPNGR